MTKPGPGKFEGNVSEEVADRLYEITMNGGHDREFGSVLDYGLWVAQIDNFLVFEDSNGFFTYAEYDTALDAANVYEQEYAAYEGWISGDA